MSCLPRTLAASGHRLVIVLALVAAFLGGACGGRAHLDKPQGSALWIGEGAAVDVPALGRLARVGVEDLFLEAATLNWNDPSSPRLVPTETPAIAGRPAATLVVVGAWPAAERDAVVVAEALAGALSRLKDGAERGGFVPIGFHLDLGVGDDLEGYAEVLEALGERLDKGLFLSVTLAPDRLAAPGAERVADAVDFLVSFAYGQRPGEAAWKTGENVDVAVEALEELGRPYLLGISTAGRLARSGDRAAGSDGDSTPRGSLGQLLSSRALELEESFSLEGIDRQTYAFEVRRPVRYGDWSLAAGETLAVERLATHHARRVLRQVERRESKRRRGVVFYEAPAPGESFSLSLESLESALGEGPLPIPDLVLEVESLGRGSLRLTLTNQGSEPTEVARLGTNYVELRVPGGRIGQVEPGEFARWQLFRPGPGGKLEQTFRGASVLRLFAPYLGPGEAVTSGAVRFQGGEPSWGGEFMAPDGQSAVPRLQAGGGEAER